MHLINIEKIIVNHAGREIFRDLTWAIGDRDRVGLVGPNGAGKSSLLKVVTGEVKPDVGGVFIMRGVQIGQYRVLRTKSPAVPNAIAAFLLHVRDQTGQIPHVYFGWTEGNPLLYVLKFIFFGEGDTAPVTHEILRQAETEQSRRPAVHVGG